MKIAKNAWDGAKYKICKIELSQRMPRMARNINKYGNAKPYDIMSNMLTLI